MELNGNRISLEDLVPAIFHRYKENKEDGWVMLLRPDITTYSKPCHVSGGNDSGKENKENCTTSPRTRTCKPNSKPAAKVVGNHTFGDEVSSPRCPKNDTHQKDFTPIAKHDHGSTDNGSQEIYVYQPPNDWCVSWWDDIQTKSFAGFPLPSAKAVASQAKESARWASLVDPNFAQMVLQYIGSVDLNRTNQTLDTSPFAIACIQGDVATVQAAIEMVCANSKPPYSKQEQIQLLLEAHESGSWSPLLLIACIIVDEDKSLANNPSLLTVAALLLQAGARPDAQDAVGKSIIHYAAGCDATPMSMRFVDMCISASKSVDLYGKQVVLDGGLTTKHLNGREGVIGGFDYLTNQRSVFVPSLGKEVWVLAENIRLADGKGRDKGPLLVDLQDHNGDTALHEIVKSNRNAVAHSLLHHHNASIHVKNNDGTTPAMMSIGCATNSIGQMISDFTRSEAEKARNTQTKIEDSCANCSKFLGKGGMKCSKCLVTLYCCRKCQTKHWKEGGHRSECKRLVAVAHGVKLSSEHLDHKTTSSSGSLDFFGDSYVKPVEVQDGAKFVVGVQINQDTKSLMISSVCDGCQFQYKSTGPGYAEVMEEVQNEAAWDGCKTYMKASFDANGDCTMYPATAGVKTDYGW